MRTQVASVPTCTGDDLLAVASSPSSPVILLPHDHSVPSVLSPSTWPWPAASLAQVESVPTCAGEERLAVFPLPRTPPTLPPHDHSVPSVFMEKIGRASCRERG